jgi:excinuclease UvrABC ATPase subunit
LINETLYGATNNRIYEKIIKTLPYKDIKGIENIDKVINIDQSPIGRTPDQIRQPMLVYLHLLENGLQIYLKPK